MPTLLEVDNLRVSFFTRKGPVSAVDGVNFRLEKGDVMGLAGESGSGKTTVALAIMRLIYPPGRIVSGRIRFDKTDLTRLSEQELRKNYRWKRMSMVFQGAMNALNPVFKVGDQIAEAIMLHEGADGHEAKARARELIELTGVDPRRANYYPHELSGGMKQRVVIAMALACNPDLVIADEPTTALDVIVQAQVLKVMNELLRKLNLSMILISHDLSVIAESCNKVGIMYGGRIVELADTVSVFKNPRHPYTQGLLNAFPSLVGPKKDLISISGQPPDLLNPPSGCRFHPRCPYASAKCKSEEPCLVDLGENHHAACHLLT